MRSLNRSEYYCYWCNTEDKVRKLGPVMVNWYPTAKWPACEEHAIGVLMFNLWMQG
jgi:hypothetical protein